VRSISNNGYLPRGTQGEVISRAQAMAEHDSLPPRLRDLQNYGPIRFRIGPGVKTLSVRQIEDLFWSTYRTFQPIKRDPLRRPR
jgi:hypothetical protein